MRYRAPVAAGLVLVSSLASVVIVAEGDGTSASASARITLRLPPRAEIVANPQFGTSNSLCLQRIPARWVSLSMPGQSIDGLPGRHLDLDGGRRCVELPPSQNAVDEQLLLISAE